MMANNINYLVLIITCTCVVWCNMYEESGIHTGTRNHMKMTGGNNGASGTHGTGGIHVL